MRKPMIFRGRQTNYLIDEVGLVYSSYQKSKKEPLRYIKNRVCIRVDGKYVQANYYELMEENWNESGKSRSH